MNSQQCKSPRSFASSSPEVVQRFVRRRMRENAKRFSRFIMRRILPFQERERTDALISALNETVKQGSKLRRYGFESTTVIMNVALFFLIAERDIQVVKIDALTHPDPWKRSLCARIILLTIHELDMDKVTGNKLKQALDAVDAPDEVKRNAIIALRTLRSVQRRAQKEFAFLRNATIAHRDPDALAQYRAITQIDELEVLQLAADFYTASHEFITLLPVLLTHVGGMRGILMQMTNRTKCNA